MGAKNKVIAGDYLNRPLMTLAGAAAILLDWKNRINLDKTEVASYEVMTEDIRKSAASGIIRGAVGAALIGPVGILAGLSAKNKSTITIAIRFKDGKNSLIEVDQKIYKAIVQAMF
jgi:hypothetical protein